MKNLSVTKIRAELGRRSLADVAEKTGLTRMALWKIATGRTRKPHPLTVERLSRYLTK